MDDCVFCKIIAGQLPAAKVYEDSDVLALMTIEAINPGHTLVISKQHEPDFYKLDGKIYSAMMTVVKNIAAAQKKTYQPPKVGLIVHGFEIPHTHVHVIPMQDPGDVTSKKLLEGTALHPSPAELAQEAERIKANL